MKKKVIGILVFMILFSSIFNIPVNAEQENNDIQYKIRQVTSREEITSDSKNDYIIIYKSPNSGNLYALASEPSSTPHVYIMSRSNAKKVKIEGDILTYSDDTNIVWTFSKSWESMADGDKPVIESIEQIYSGPYKTKKQFISIKKLFKFLKSTPKQSNIAPNYTLRRSFLTKKAKKFAALKL